jgi:hypothetical protein
MTTDYGRFKFIDDNRMVVPSHLEELKASIQETNLLYANPIIVNEKLEVFDGQHRLLAAEDLEVSIYYDIIPNLSSSAMITLNVLGLNWKPENFARYYASKGNNDYSYYLNFRKENDLNHQSAMAFLLAKDWEVHGGGQTSRHFKAGLFTVLDKEYAETAVKQLRDYRWHYKGYLRRSFIKAVLIVLRHSEYDHEWMINRLDLIGSRLTDRVNTLDYLRDLEDIYGYNTPSKKIRFS